MDTIKEDLLKRYEIARLESEIYLWQVCIIDKPDEKDCYQNAIADNLHKLKTLEEEI